MKSSNKEVGIVIVNYNGAKYQNDCIKSLYEMTYQDFEIIVIDSASKDNSIELLQKEYPNVLVFKQNDNVGVAKGNNIGIKESLKLGTKYTLLLNNDIVVDKNLLERLVKASNNEYITVPKIYYYEPNNMIWYGGGDFKFNIGTATHRSMKEIDKGQCDKEEFVDYSPTCCMLIPNWVFDKVGYIDENYFMYYDDTDFCLRVLDNGIKIKYVPSSFMWHKVSSSTGGEGSPLSTYYGTRNKFYFMNKFPKYMGLGCKVYSYLSFIVQYIISPIRCKNDKYIKDALYDYTHGNMGRRDNLIKK